MISPPRIAIIGAGASGTLSAAHLLHEAPGDVEITMIEPRAELGQGVAYSTSDPRHLLNVRAGCMSAFPDPHRRCGRSPSGRPTVDASATRGPLVRSSGCVATSRGWWWGRVSRRSTSSSACTPPATGG